MAHLRALLVLLACTAVLAHKHAHPEIRFAAGQPLDETPDRRAHRLISVDITLTPARILVRRRAVSRAATKVHVPAAVTAYCRHRRRRCPRKRKCMHRLPTGTMHTLACSHGIRRSPPA